MYKLKQTKTEGKIKYCLQQDDVAIDIHTLSLVEIIKLALENKIYNKQLLNTLVLPSQKINCYLDLQAAYAFYLNVPKKYQSKTIKIIHALDEKELMQHATDMAESGKISVENFLQMVVKTELRYKEKLK